jgi:hypothetical protein
MKAEAFEPLSMYYLAPDYATRAAAEAATGKTLPVFTAKSRPKGWQILEPEKVEGVQLFDFDGVPMVMFPRAFFGKQAADGSGVLESLVMSVEEAKTFNLPPTGIGQTNVPGADKLGRPVPLKALSDRQKIMRKDFATGWQVRNLDVMLPGELDTGFTPADRADLQAIKAAVVK